MATPQDDPAQFDTRDARRLGRAGRWVERFDRLRGNGSGPARFAAMPRQQVGWPVRITGTPSMGDPDLYPAVVLEFAGYLGGTPTWEDGEECWVIPYPGGTGLRPGPTHAEPVGVHDDDEKVILAALPTGPAKWVTDSCLVADAYGAVVGQALFIEHADGRGQCVVRGICSDCGEADVPPPPPAPCVTLSGTVTLQPEAAGVYTGLYLVGYGGFFSDVGTGAYSIDLPFGGATIGFTCDVPPAEAPRSVYYSTDGGASWTLATDIGLLSPTGFMYDLPAECEPTEVLWELWATGYEPDVINPPVEEEPPPP